MLSIYSFSGPFSGCMRSEAPDWFIAIQFSAMRFKYIYIYIYIFSCCCLLIILFWTLFFFHKFDFLVKALWWKNVFVENRNFYSLWESPHFQCCYAKRLFYSAQDGVEGIGYPNSSLDLSSEMEVDAFRRLFPLRFFERHLSESIRPDGRPLGRARDSTLALGVLKFIVDDMNFSIFINICI